MFASGALARRIEGAEAARTLAVGERARAKRPAIVLPLCGGAAVFAGGTPFDKIIGIGFAPLDVDALAGFERDVHARGGTVQAEVSTLADPSVARTLTGRGYQLIGFENVLGMRLDESAVTRLGADLPGDLRVDRARQEELPLFIDVVSEGFVHPDTFDGPASHESFTQDAVKAVFRDIAAGSGFRGYLARRGGEVAGGGSFSIQDGIAGLAGAATLPAHRRRGVQTALLRARLLDAAEAGCDLATVTTQPGSVSQANVMRAGFSLLYARAVLASAPR